MHIIMVAKEVIGLWSSIVSRQSLRTFALSHSGLVGPGAANAKGGPGR
jgi:hypothetical protein